MPCNCMKARVIPNYPTNVEWGPAYWGILHGLAERAGSFTTTPRLQVEERRKWGRLFNTLANAIPCYECRDHYRLMLRSINILVLNTMPYSELKTFLKTTLWNMHNTVNVRLEKPEFPFESLETTYFTLAVTPLIDGVKPVIDQAVRLGGMKSSDWVQFSNNIRYFAGLYGA